MGCAEPTRGAPVATTSTLPVSGAGAVSVGAAWLAAQPASASASTRARIARPYPAWGAVCKRCAEGARATPRTVRMRPLAVAAAHAPPTASAATWRAFAGFTHRERPPPEGLAVQGGDRRLRLRVGRHFDEGKAARPSGLPVGHDLHLLDLAPILFEEGAQLCFLALIRKVPYIQSFTHSSSRTCDASRRLRPSCATAAF